MSSKRSWVVIKWDTTLLHRNALSSESIRDLRWIWHRRTHADFTENEVGTLASTFLSGKWKHMLKKGQSEAEVQFAQTLHKHHTLPMRCLFSFRTHSTRPLWLKNCDIFNRDQKVSLPPPFPISLRNSFIKQMCVVTKDKADTRLHSSDCVHVHKRSSHSLTPCCHSNIYRQDTGFLTHMLLTYEHYMHAIN